MINLAPDESIGYGNLAVAHLRLKQREEAEAWVKRGLEVEPMDSQLHFILAEIYQSQSRTAEAVAAIQEAVKLAPDDLETRYKLTRHYLSQRNNPDADRRGNFPPAGTARTNPGERSGNAQIGERTFTARTG